MIVRELGALLEQRQRMSLQELSRHFAADEQAIDAMLGIWMRKGRIRKLQSGGCSGRCCGERETVMYEWLPQGQIGLIQH
ncbi:FeoC-like transcriptional regulator [Pseudaeromonas sharmana]|uniref:FeoC-like transcriptional regulator n=1 Tax=Pseudaeromonas sharmana TaxID=328412 RepID=A0ABV8CRQ4_9GAMM